MTLDFDEFHPLDHIIGTPICRTYHGGVRIHLSYAWQYKWRDRLIRFYRYPLFCWLNYHRLRPCTKRTNERLYAGRICTDCGSFFPSTPLIGTCDEIFYGELSYGAINEMDFSVPRRCVLPLGHLGHHATEAMLPPPAS